MSPEHAFIASGAFGVAAGILSGFLGIGGGAILPPLLVIALGVGHLPAVYMYAREERGLPWALLVAVAMGFALGAGGGAYLAGRVNARAAAAVYASFRALMAIVLVVHG